MPTENFTSLKLKKIMFQEIVGNQEPVTQLHTHKSLAFCPEEKGATKRMIQVEGNTMTQLTPQNPCFLSRGRSVQLKD